MFLEDSQPEIEPTEMCIIEEVVISADEDEDCLNQENSPPPSPIAPIPPPQQQKPPPPLKVHVAPQPAAAQSAGIVIHPNKRKYSSNNGGNDEHTLMYVEGGEDDKFDIFGKVVAFKLRRINNLQNSYAQKIILNTLYNAERNKLSTTTYLCLGTSVQSRSDIKIDGDPEK